MPARVTIHNSAYNNSVFIKSTTGWRLQVFCAPRSASSGWAPSSSGSTSSSEDSAPFSGSSWVRFLSQGGGGGSAVAEWSKARLWWEKINEDQKIQGSPSGLGNPKKSGRLKRPELREKLAKVAELIIPINSNTYTQNKLYSVLLCTDYSSVYY